MVACFWSSHIVLDRFSIGIQASTMSLHVSSLRQMLQPWDDEDVAIQEFNWPWLLFVFKVFTCWVSESCGHHMKYPIAGNCRIAQGLDPFQRCPERGVEPCCEHVWGRFPLSILSATAHIIQHKLCKRKYVLPGLGRSRTIRRHLRTPLLGNPFSLGQTLACACHARP